MAVSCVLRSLLSRTLSRFGCSGAPRHSYTADQIISEARDHTACWVTVKGHEATRRNIPKGPRGGEGRRILWAAVAFSLFSSTEEDKRDEAQRKEDEMILLLKKAKVSEL
ncbi:tetratricopeptide repeat protein 19, mitochondrial [Kryptolebias marmoratus]|uniref:tetratricopeptide repeat protein 19, mitochondrial n=1 Tax=Kryptolebias marmoratus TaxID=37003 RepID=UPI0018ACBB07|nr:tetratricopeptide repeat protein 19, mitochondrial [Kryptolebias marmoratus]